MGFARSLCNTTAKLAINRVKNNIAELRGAKKWKTIYCLMIGK